MNYTFFKEKLEIFFPDSEIFWKLGGNLK